MTIKERAHIYADDKICEECINVSLNPCECVRHSRVIDEYVKIATEQQELDIQRAVEWLEENMQTNYENVCVAESKEFETHTEFISRFEKSMKRE